MFFDIEAIMTNSNSYFKPGFSLSTGSGGEELVKWIIQTSKMIAEDMLEIGD
jgi:citrate lyase alpha subunit